jgi:hypothetical protein
MDRIIITAANVYLPTGKTRRRAGRRRWRGCHPTTGATATTGGTHDSYHRGWTPGNSVGNTAVTGMVPHSRAQRSPRIVGREQPQSRGNTTVRNTPDPVPTAWLGGRLGRPTPLLAQLPADPTAGSPARNGDAAGGDGRWNCAFAADPRERLGRTPLGGRPEPPPAPSVGRPAVGPAPFSTAGPRVQREVVPH